MKSTGYCLCAQ